MKIKIKRLDSSIELPKYHTAESAAFDIASSEDTEILPQEIKLVHTGLIIESPKDHFLMIAARSSTPKKKGLMVPQGVGIVDRDYSGPEDEILLQLYNFTNKPVKITKGERLCQGLFVRVDQIEWDEKNELRDKTRGGFGSTGGLDA